MSSIVQRIWTSVESHGDREAIVAADGRLTYRELAALVRGIQNRLFAATPTPGRVGIMTDDSVYTYAAIVAVLAAGAAYVPINSKNPRSRNIDVILRAKLDVILAHSDDAAIGAGEDGVDLPGFVSIREARPANEPWFIADVQGDSLAYILFTSGSTGRPKGVPITHGNLLAFMDATFGAGPYSAGPGDRFLQMFELTFDLSVMCVLVPLCHGAAVCVVPEQGIGFMNVAKTLADERVTIALMVPSMLSYLKRYMPELDFPDVRLNLFCGEALPHDLLTLWSACVSNATIENTYGPTEATIFCSRFPYSADTPSANIFQGVISIGKPLDGIRLFVVDNEDRVLPPGEQGELCISGSQVMDGYWHDPDKTAEAMSTLAVGSDRLTVYRTGDIVFVNEHGNLNFCGRKDSQVKIDGHRVELGEIEHQAREYLGHGMVAVLLIDSPDGRKTLVLFAELGPGKDGKDLAEHLAARLPVYMRPGRIEQLDSMPLNLNGKIDRPALRERYLAAS